ncbi:hypothetical protein LSH36_174g03078 [Paralvinella palmiformis]|uniref:Uncharacterized protein n=1 Tax=Paralvinella palmiformis TaxID=53620 RepID=A0AAD9JS96_9ANNE|nr:hypothetical protein LSH36_174g03078 [Paralvinella palmiformis]
MMSAMGQKIEFLQVRYDRAFQAHERSFRYTYRLQLATLEGMRNMYYEYACRRADELEVIQDRLIQHGLISDSSDMSDDGDEESNF